MPELPELQALAEGLDRAVRGAVVSGMRIHHPATLRTADPAPEAVAGRAVAAVWRRGKLIGLAMEGGLVLVMHLMSSGRLGLTTAGSGRPGRTACLDLDIEGAGVLRLRELGTRRRASAHLLRVADLAAHPPYARLGPEPIGLAPADWASALAAPPASVLHSALRDGRRVAGIGRAYAADIMWAARLAPFAPAARLDDEQFGRLARAADTVLGQALERARERIGTALPAREDRVTMVHGHHGDPCLRCATPLARVSFAEYELVYCPTCQTGGRRYRDRRLSRLRVDGG
jgi:formamidopyrimidine-DNA glycosylase